MMINYLRKQQKQKKQIGKSKIDTYITYTSSNILTY